MNRRGSWLANITNKTNRLFNDSGNHVFFKTEKRFFKTIIYNAKYNANIGNNNGIKELSEREKAIVELLKKDPTLTLDEISLALKISKRTLARIIAALKERGIIVRKGSNKDGHWEFL